MSRKKKGPSVVRKISIKGEGHRIVRATRKTGVKRKPTHGYQLQNYGRTRPGKKGWMNVGGGFKKSLSDMTKYIKNIRKARHY